MYDQSQGPDARAPSDNGLLKSLGLELSRRYALVAAEPPPEEFLRLLEDAGRTRASSARLT